MSKITSVVCMSVCLVLVSAWLNSSTLVVVAQELSDNSNSEGFGFSLESQDTSSGVNEPSLASSYMNSIISPFIGQTESPPTGLHVCTDILCVADVYKQTDLTTSLAFAKHMLSNKIFEESVVDNLPSGIGTFSFIKGLYNNPQDYGVLEVDKAAFVGTEYSNHETYYCVFDRTESQVLFTEGNIELADNNACGGKKGLFVGVSDNNLSYLFKTKQVITDVATETVLTEVNKFVEATKIPTTPLNATPLKLDDRAVARFSRFFETQLGHAEKLFTLQETNVTDAIADQNQLRDEEAADRNALRDAEIKLRQFWTGNDIIKHNNEVLRLHRQTGHITFWVALAVFGVGLLLSLLQFFSAYVQQLKVKEDLNKSVGVSSLTNELTQTIQKLRESVVVPQNFQGTSNDVSQFVQAATQQSLTVSKLSDTIAKTVEAGEKQYEHEVEAEFNKIKLVMRTNAIGVIILAFSIVFFALYLTFVFPVSFPSGQEVQANTPSNIDNQQGLEEGGEQ